MTQYLYPQNLKATANLWLWSLRDFVIFCTAVLVGAAVHCDLGAARILSSGSSNAVLRISDYPHG